MLYHFVIDGGAVVQLIDGPSVELTAGDVVIFPHARQHHMTSGTRFSRAISELRNFRQDQVARPESIAGWRRRCYFAIRVRVHDLRSPISAVRY